MVGLAARLGRDAVQCRFLCQSSRTTSHTVVEPAPSRCFAIQKAEVIRRYDLLYVGAGPEGHDIARPAKWWILSGSAVGQLHPRTFACERAPEMLALAKKLP